ncbi:MAG: four helix bundle protein [Vicinamibacterales bacterium]
MSRPLDIENLKVWKLACAFEDGVLDLLERSPRAVRDAKFYVQLGDAASSVPNNVAEGFYRFNAVEFANFLRYSRGSLGEAERRLRAGVRKSYWQQTAADPWLALAVQLGPAISGFRSYLLAAAARKRARERRRKRR